MRLRNDKRDQRIREAQTRNEKWRALSDEDKAYILYHHRRGDSDRQLRKLTENKPTTWLASALMRAPDAPRPSVQNWPVNAEF